MNKMNSEIILSKGLLKNCKVSRYGQNQILVIPDWITFMNKGEAECWLIERFFYIDLCAMTILGECPILPNMHPCFIVSETAIFVGKIDTDTGIISHRYLAAHVGDNSWESMYIFFTNLLTSE